MTVPSDLVPSLVLAIASPPDGGAVSPWVQLVPFALVLAIFYFIILMPMRRRQKKVDEFFTTLKKRLSCPTTRKRFRDFRPTGAIKKAGRFRPASLCNPGAF